jgi:hypothetical protein
MLAQPQFPTEQIPLETDCWAPQISTFGSDPVAPKWTFSSHFHHGHSTLIAALFSFRQPTLWLILVTIVRWLDPIIMSTKLFKRKWFPDWFWHFCLARLFMHAYGWLFFCGEGQVTRAPIAHPNNPFPHFSLLWSALIFHSFFACLSVFDFSRCVLLFARVLILLFFACFSHFNRD